MKKLIMVLTLASILGACSSSTPVNDKRIASGSIESEAWWKTAGEADSEYWWVSFEDESE